MADHMRLTDKHLSFLKQFGFTEPTQSVRDFDYNHFYSTLRSENEREQRVR